jgi:hypothetical protein
VANPCDIAISTAKTATTRAMPKTANSETGHVADVVGERQRHGYGFLSISVIRAR